MPLKRMLPPGAPRLRLARQARATWSPSQVAKPPNRERLPTECISSGKICASTSAQLIALDRKAARCQQRRSPTRWRSRERLLRCTQTLQEATITSAPIASSESSRRSSAESWCAMPEANPVPNGRAVRPSEPRTPHNSRGARGTSSASSRTWKKGIQGGNFSRPTNKRGRERMMRAHRFGGLQP